MSIVKVENLNKLFGSMAAVDDVSFEVGEGEILVIVGASGCGKTTTLRCIAGLETPTSGTITVSGRTMSSADTWVPPEKRGIGMMFQSYALWPHMTVAGNVGYGLRLKRTPKKEARVAVDRVLDLVGLGGMGERYPSTLSGGQQQRVALARSVVAEQKVILLDEPLSNLDAKLREDMRTELRSLVKKLKMTAIHITHDQLEAMALADSLIYMRNGRIEQSGSPRDIYRSPVNVSVADFIGKATFFDGTLEGASSAEGAKVRIAPSVELLSRKVAPTVAGTEVRVAIRPEDVTISTLAPAGHNALKATVTAETFLGAHTEYALQLDGIAIMSYTTADFQVGSSVYIQIDPDRIVCLPRT